MTDKYPPQIVAFHALLEQLPGLSSLESSVESLQGIGISDLRLVDFGHLPHGALRRTEGGLRAEVLVQVAFRLDASSSGWKTLEFLAWFIRDQARGGQAIQLRPHALPPRASDHKQLGQTLTFHIEMFFQNIQHDLTPVLDTVADIAHSLEMAIRLYRAELYA